MIGKKVSALKAATKAVHSLTKKAKQAMQSPEAVAAEMQVDIDELGSGAPVSRHHCRWCGDVYCATHSSERRRVRNGEVEKVCDLCAILLGGVKEISNREAAGSPARVPDPLPDPLNEPIREVNCVCEMDLHRATQDGDPSRIDPFVMLSTECAPLLSPELGCRAAIALLSLLAASHLWKVLLWAVASASINAAAILALLTPTSREQLHEQAPCASSLSPLVDWARVVLAGGDACLAALCLGLAMRLLHAHPPSALDGLCALGDAGCLAYTATQNTRQLLLLARARAQRGNYVELTELE
ncbi:hypothetical protein EMIHUDRAFT_469497 [Emiliania huxleyi CCMP1516]|nr:hypothetical protein EMIHUDRAFT_469497 [Emiliania huxleyi CCMP1516]EOD23575.1 hypothetical protein EMIHUDRAFT_469497 [Emiliania huxleyi CCMP1516]|eukprot:XP_005776004.1 hypothetical protein EMIHUDRAFT_469497 [Emiliania huxleyi CCMP1516]